MRVHNVTYPRPLVSADLRLVDAVFTDVDGTLTEGGKLTSDVLSALEQLKAASIRVVLVTGRPAGYGECWVRTLPVDGVIVENGGLYFAWSANGRLKKVYARSAAQRAADRRRLKSEVARAMRQVKGARLSMDTLYTEVDLAVDYNEEASLGAPAADKLERALRARGLNAVRSSVHVNCWIGPFDKRTAALRFMKSEWGVPWPDGAGRFLYVGDSFNDAPMFDAFPLSVGVANVLDVWQALPSAPRFVTRAREGRGFVELAAAVLEARRSRA